MQGLIYGIKPSMYDDECRGKLEIRNGGWELTRLSYKIHVTTTEGHALNKT